jgi:hypothetical protein
MSLYKRISQKVKHVLGRSKKTTSPASPKKSAAASAPPVKQREPISEAQKAHSIPRNEHSISRKNISSNAVKVLYRLHEGGYQAF